MIRKSILRRFPVYLLASLAFFLPFHFLLAPVIGLLTISILISLPFHEIFKNLKSNSLFVLFSFCYLLFVLAMINTENQDSGFKELGQKFSFFIFPIILAAMGKLKTFDFKFIVYSFLSSLFLACLISFTIGYAENSYESIPTYIELSTFLHPTYFSAYLNLAFIFLVIFIGFKKTQTKRNILLLLLVGFVILFNFLLNSKLGVIINILLIFSFLLKSFSGGSKKTVIFLGFTFVAALVLIFTQVSSIKSRFLSISQTFNADRISKDTNESTTLRVLIWKEALQIIKEYPLVGVGTGDTKEVLLQQYKNNGISYAYANELNAHNQYLEWLITFGILGTFYWIASILYTLGLSFKRKNFLFIWFQLLILGMLMGESFLEREVGVVFFAFFNSLLFFHAPVQSSES